MLAQAFTETVVSSRLASLSNSPKISCAPANIIANVNTALRGRRVFISAFPTGYLVCFIARGYD